MSHQREFWITNGPVADVVVVYAMTDAGRKQRGMTAFLVEKGREGFVQNAPLDKSGQASSLLGSQCNTVIWCLDILVRLYRGRQRNASQEREGN